MRDGPRYDTHAWFLTMRDHKIVSAVALFDSVEFKTSGTGSSRPDPPDPHPLTAPSEEWPCTPCSL